MFFKVDVEGESFSFYLSVVVYYFRSFKVTNLIRFILIPLGKLLPINKARTNISALGAAVNKSYIPRSIDGKRYT